jgi:rhamnogalacturonan endolyase
LWNIKGEKIADSTPSVNFGVYWDGDLLREMLDGTTVSKWNWEKGAVETLLDASTFGVASNNGTKATPVLSADLFGDWREEVILRTTDGRELRVFSSTIPTTHRVPTLMSDPVYRLGIAWQNVGYNQPPHLSYFLDPNAR